jgi:capsular polysaccharide biosynthesis protein
MKDNPTISIEFLIGIFLGVFVFVFTLIFGICIVTTSLTPKSYESEVRVKVKYNSADGGQTRSGKYYGSTLAQTEAEIISSEIIMRQVVLDLNLNEAWGKKYGVGTLKTWETLEFLTNMISIHPVPDTALIKIQTYNDSPEDAATIANSIAKAYISYTATNNNEVVAQIIDSAYANKIPVRPNKPLNYTLGIVGGLFLGFLAGLGTALIVFLKNRKASKASVN